MLDSFRQRVALIADSTCDIPPAMVADYGITIIPLHVIWGEQQYLDRITLTPQAFYERLAADPVYPSSSHPTPEEFLEVYRTAQEAGAAAIVVLTISSAMSGTFEAAQRAAELCGMPVSIVDGKGPTMSLGWQVLAAARARDAALARDRAASVDVLVEAMVSAADNARATMAQLVYMDAVTYLQKGGRIGNAASLIGTALRIRPVIYIDHATGVVNLERAARTRKRGIEALISGFYRRLDVNRPLHIAILHGNDSAAAEMLAERVQREISPAELVVNVTGPVLGISTGPKALALAGYNE